MANTQFLTDLQALLAARKPLARQIDFERVFVRLEGLTYQEQADVVLWLFAEGGEWVDDRKSYEDMGQEYQNTFHLWIDTDEVRLYCGFQFNGNPPENNYAFTIRAEGLD